MYQHIRLATRSLMRAPGFASTAIITLALGIGLASAVFAIANAFFLRPLPIRDQNQVTVLWGATRDGRFDNFPLLLADAREFAARARSLARVEFFAYGGASPTPIRDDRGSISRLRRSLVSGGYFDLLGVQPLLGRVLRPEDDVVGAAPVVVLSYGAWKQRFGGDPLVLGRRIIVHETGVAHTIVGVIPRGLDYPRGTELWSPVIPASRPLGSEPVYAELNVIGRLRPGASVADAGGELSDYFARPGAPRMHRDLHGVAKPLVDAIVGDVKPAVVAFAAASGLLLLITCINVANLLLVRGLARTREIAVRSALGAGRGRIVRQLATESLLLAAVGGVLGIGLAAAAVRGFVAFAPEGIPRLDEVEMNGAAIVGAVAVTALVTLLFALVPALVTSRAALQDALRAGARQSGGSRRFRLGTEALVVGQVALALMVLSAAGLVTRSLLNLGRVELSLDPSRLLIGELALPFQQFGDTRKQLALLDRLLPRLEGVPGVTGVSPVLTIPFTGAGGIFGTPATEGQSEEEAAHNPVLDMEVVTPNYFATLGVRLLRGRVFTDEDREGTTPVVVLSESAARRYWPGADPIGKRLTLGGARTSMTVVGIVPETRYRDLRDARPSIYFPLRQSVFPVAPMTLAIRTARGSSDLVPAIRRAIGETDPGVALSRVSSFESLLDGPRAQPRLNALLLAVFAVAAVALAAVGLYGVMTTMVRQRTHELGVRMALGATGSDLLRMVIGRGLALAAVGTAAGLAGASAANRLLRAMLFEVSPTDGPTLGVVAAALLLVAAVASIIPARSSTRIDPVIALRAEG